MLFHSFHAFPATNRNASSSSSHGWGSLIPLLNPMSIIISFWKASMTCLYLIISPSRLFLTLVYACIGVLTGNYNLFTSFSLAVLYNSLKLEALSYSFLCLRHLAYCLTHSKLSTATSWIDLCLFMQLVAVWWRIRQYTNIREEIGLEVEES